MRTRAVPVVVNRSPGGGNGWWIKVGERTGLWISCSEQRAMEALRNELTALQMSREEKSRVERLILRELDRKRDAEVTGEAPVS